MDRTARFKTTSASTSELSIASARSSNSVCKNEKRSRHECRDRFSRSHGLFQSVENTSHKLETVALISKCGPVEIVIQHIDVQAETLVRRQLQPGPKDRRISAHVIPRGNKCSGLREDDLCR